MSRFVIVGVMLSACATNGGAIVPRAGTWTYSEVTPVSNSCGSQINQIESGDFAIDSPTASGFRVIPNDGTAAFACSSSGASFECPNRAAATDDLRPGVDAVIAIQASVDGAFSDASHATGSQVANATCTGTQCAQVAPFPCSFTVNFAISAL